VSPDKVDALESWRQSNLFDGREQAVLDYAEAMTRSDLKVEDEQVELLRSYFDDDGIVELTGVSYFGMPTKPMSRNPMNAATNPRKNALYAELSESL
jgi:hypothetical protein